MTRDLQKLPRIAYLESIRGVAALQVLLLHFFAAFAPDLVYSLPAGAAIAGYIHLSPLYFLYDGYSAVYIFFALSGYVLTRSFERHLARPAAERLFSQVLFSQFLARLVRLGLPGLAATLVAAAMMSMFGKPNIAAGGLGGSTWFVSQWNTDVSILSVIRDGTVNALFLGYRGLPGVAFLRRGNSRSSNHCRAAVDAEHRILWLDDHPAVVRLRAAIPRGVVVGRVAGCDVYDPKRLCLLFRRAPAGSLLPRRTARA